MQVWLRCPATFVLLVSIGSHLKNFIKMAFQVTPVRVKSSNLVVAAAFRLRNIYKLFPFFKRKLKLAATIFYCDKASKHGVSNANINWFNITIYKCEWLNLTNLFINQFLFKYWLVLTCPKQTYVLEDFFGKHRVFKPSIFLVAHILLNLIST